MKTCNKIKQQTKLGSLKIFILTSLVFFVLKTILIGYPIMRFSKNKYSKMNIIHNSLEQYLTIDDDLDNNLSISQSYKTLISENDKLDIQINSHSEIINLYYSKKYHVLCLSFIENNEKVFKCKKLN